MKIPRPASGAKFSEYHLLKALLNIKKTGNACGRDKLIQILALTEASTRSLMQKLKRAGLVNNSTKGLVLSKNGVLLVNQINRKTSGPIAVENFEQPAIAFLARNSAKKIKQGIEERDIAVRAGADGALVIVCSDAKLTIPGAPSSVESALLKELGEKLKPKTNDVVILAFSNSKAKAGAGAWAVVQTLI
jgi:hypothetical protein